MAIKTLLENIWVGVVKNGRDFLGHGTLESAVSQKWIEELSLFVTCWYKFRNAKSYFNNSWMGIVKTGRYLLVHGTLKSTVSWE